MHRPPAARALLRHAVLDRAPYLATRGEGLKLSHVVDHVGMAALADEAHLPDAALSAAIDTAVNVMIDADLMARRVMAEVRSSVDREVRDSDLSVFVATACGRSLRRHGRLPIEREEHDLVDRLIVRMSSSLREELLGPEAFVAIAGPLYREWWLTGGARRMTASPPSQIGLGHDERPPLLTAPTKESRTWCQGSDRSVYSRYLLYYDGRSRRRVSDHRRHACPQDAHPRTIEDPLRLSVHLTCQTFGLEHDGHGELLRILADSVDASEAGEDGARRRFVDWDVECRPLPVGPGDDRDDVVGRVMELQRAWWGSIAGRLLRDRFGSPPTYLHLVRILLVRRAWQNLLGREREEERAAGTCSVDGILGVALTMGVATELPSQLRGERGLPPPPSVQRTQATLDLVTARWSSSADSVRQDSLTAIGIVDWYESQLLELGAIAEHELLTHAEFAGLVDCTGVWEHSRREVRS